MWIELTLSVCGLNSHSVNMVFSSDGFVGRGHKNHCSLYTIFTACIYLGLPLAFQTQSPLSQNCNESRIKFVATVRLFYGVRIPKTRQRERYLSKTEMGCTLTVNYRSSFKDYGSGGRNNRHCD
jgi:hypothetical protein